MLLMKSNSKIGIHKNHRETNNLEELSLYD